MDLQASTIVSPRSFSVAISDPFTLWSAREGEVAVHPRLSHLGHGELLLRISPDWDIFDEEQYIFSSVDGGRTWDPISNWPMGDGAGRHLYQEHVRLPDGRSLVVPIYLVSTGNEDEYIIPAWISSEDGKTGFRKLESVPFHFPYGRTVDVWDPLQWAAQRRGGPRNHEENYLYRPGPTLATDEKVSRRFWAQLVERTPATALRPGRFNCFGLRLRHSDGARSLANRAIRKNKSELDDLPRVQGLGSFLGSALRSRTLGPRPRE